MAAAMAEFGWRSALLWLGLPGSDMRPVPVGVMRHTHALHWAALAWLLLGAWPVPPACGGAMAAEARAGVSSTIRPDYPVPPANARRLFYLQRSSNANTVVYDAKLLASGRLDPERPVDVYWLRYNTDGERRGLNFAERKFAYGVEATPVDDDVGGYRVHIAALSDRPFRLFLDQAGVVQAVMELGGRPVRLQSVYLELTEGGLLPGVRHIDIFGVELASGRPVHERIIP